MQHEIFVEGKIAMGRLNYRSHEYHAYGASVFRRMPTNSQKCYCIK